jgi:inorganic pyrophosphatase
VLEQKFTAHPWHGIKIGDNSPELINSFIEIIPSDAMKYEVDKASGYIMVDRPQKYSNHLPAMYGFVPQTICKEQVAEYCMEKTGKTGIEGDDDPLDICVLSEREVNRGSIIVEAIPIGGFRMIDGGEADDKIVAVVKGDHAYGNITDIKDAPEMVINRLKHFFLTYKDLEGDSKEVEITHTYGREEALEVINRSYNDYLTHYGVVDQKLKEVLAGVEA